MVSKWPISLVLKELGLYLTVKDASTLIDLYQYMDREDWNLDYKDLHVFFFGGYFN